MKKINILLLIRLFLIFTLLIGRAVMKGQRPFFDPDSCPNVVLIVSHGHGMGDLGCYGNSSIHTPNLDRLAADGVKFTHAYATVSSAGASESVILTGLYNHANGQYGKSEGQSHFSVFPEVHSLPGYLKIAGYITARIGFYPLTDCSFPFDTLLGTEVNNRNTYQMAEHCSPLFAIKDKPFLLYFSPADPYRSSETSGGETNQINSFGNSEQGYPGIIPTYYKPEKIMVPSYLPDLPVCRKELAQYAQSVSRMDLGIGRLFELLKKSGKWNNTLIIYITDSGIGFPGAQSTLYEPGIKLPCIIKPPFEKNQVTTCEAMINWADITPTILDFCHAIPSEYPFHGRSFKESMNRLVTTGWDELFASHTFDEITSYYPMRMVMNRRYKLIWNIAWQLPYPIPNNLLYSATWQEIIKISPDNYGKRIFKDFMQRNEFELYDLIADPDEIKNLASNPEYAGILTDLKSRLKGFQVKTNDPWVIF